MAFAPAMKKTTAVLSIAFAGALGPERMWLPVLFHHHYRDCIRICFCDCFRKRIG